MNTRQTLFEPLPPAACSALAEILPNLLNHGWVHSMCSTIDGTILLQAKFHDGRWIKAEIEDSEHIGAALPEGHFSDFTATSLNAWMTQNS